MSSSGTSFGRFYDTWFDQLHHLVHQLRTSPKHHNHHHHHPAASIGATASCGATAQENDLTHVLVQNLMNHYAEYYKVKSAATERDVLSVFSAPWASPLERALYWVAGWRPTTLFHLVYTESSILFEFHIIDILKGLKHGDLGDLSPTQFGRVSELQCEAVKQENAITDELSEWQDGASELMLGECVDIDEKIGRLVSIVKKADDLRLRTLRRVVELLTANQAAEFLVAAAELQFGVRMWGMKKDQILRERGDNNNNNPERDSSS